MPSDVRWWIGTAGWSYPDWHGIVYPARHGREFRPLTALARLFNAVEVNSTFYGMPDARITALWTPQVPDDFRFAIKLHQDFTHAHQRSQYSEHAQRFLAALVPLRDSGKLGPVLIQFPWSFRYCPASVEHVARLADLLPDLSRAIEVRHASWSTPEAQAQLTQHGVLCCIDQPQLRDCLAPASPTAAPFAYLRLHGRNAAHWFAENEPAYERYNYLYSEAELSEWASRLVPIASSFAEFYVFANNHYRGQAVANALELRALLGLPPCEIPHSLFARYPRLERVAAAVTPCGEPRLFD